MNIPADHPLAGAAARIIRARKHFAELRAAIAATIEQHKNSFVIEFDPQPPHGIRPRRPQNLPTPYLIGVLAGEIAYNLRSALDYLAFELALLDSRSSQDGTQFPIADKPKDFKWWVERKGWLKGVNAAHVAAIERLQPYNGCTWTGALRDISNPDKHRQLVGICGNFVGQGFSRPDTPDFDQIAAPIARAAHPIHGEVDVKFYFSEQILFGDGSPIIETLEELIREAADTLEAFKPEF